MSATAIHCQQKSCFEIGRWGALALGALSVVMLLATAVPARAQLDATSVKTLISQHLDRPMGLLGPLPVSATGIDVRPIGEGFNVELTDPRVLNAPLTSFTFRLVPLANQVLRVDSVQLLGSATASFDRWDWQGHWDLLSDTYATLVYDIANARLTTPFAMAAIDRLGLSITEANSGGDNNPTVTQLTIQAIKLSPPKGNQWFFAADTIDWEYEAGTNGESLYAQIAKQIAQWTALQQAGRMAILSDEPLRGQLSQLVNLGAHWARAMPPAPVEDQSEASITGLNVKLPFDAVSVVANHLSYQSGTAQSDTGINTTPVAVRVRDLAINRREDQLAVNDAQLSLSIQNLSPALWADAFQRLFQTPSPGDTWAFVPNLITFYDGLVLSGQLKGLALTLPDRQVAVMLDGADGALSLSQMMQDGAGVELTGEWHGANVASMAALPQGQVPEPLVFNGRVLRFDPLTQAMIPKQGRGRIVIDGLPLGQVRQSLAYQPRIAPLLEGRAFAREAATAGLVLITPFLITPPEVTVTDTVVKGGGYQISADAQLAINPVLPPFYAVGTADLRVQGMNDLANIADEILVNVDPDGSELDQDLWDWANRIRHRWLALFMRHATPGSAPAHRYRFEATSLGQLLLNDVMISAPQ